VYTRHRANNLELVPKCRNIANPSEEDQTVILTKVTTNTMVLTPRHSRAKLRRAFNARQQMEMRLGEWRLDHAATKLHVEFWTLADIKYVWISSEGCNIELKIIIA
jgi:hypothetical protein